MRLLLCEDEHAFSDALCTILEHNNYTVDAVYDGEDAYTYGLSDNYDGILLDVMMPKADGLTVLQNLRTAGVQTPVLLLTAKSDVEDRVAGLNLGADDYLPKPFVMAELRALTRRQGEYRHSTLRFGDLVLSRTDFNLSAPRGTVRLVGKEFQICELFLSNPRQLLSPEQLLTKIWGYDTDVEINVVWVNISNLRKKFAEIGAHVSIRSVRGAGYILEETL